MQSIAPRTIKRGQFDKRGKFHFVPEIKTVLWDSPELRRAFKEASEKERAKRRK